MRWTPDQVILRYEVLRESIGGVHGIDPTTIRGERCARCARLVLDTTHKIRARLRRAAQSEYSDVLDPLLRRRLVQQRVSMSMDAAIEDELASRGLSQGWKTRVRIPGRVREGRNGERIEEPPREKDLCGACLERNAQLHGYERAVSVTPDWRGVADAKHRGGVSVSHRTDATEQRLVAQLDEWRFVAPVVTFVPPGQAPRDWRFGRLAILLLHRCGEAMQRNRAIVRAVDLGRQEFPDSGPWSIERLERCVRAVRSGIRRRIEAPHRWQQEEEEQAVGPRETVSLSEAAALLECSVEHVRSVLLPGWREAGQATDASGPSSRRRRWRVQREAVERERRRRFEQRVG